MAIELPLPQHDRYDYVPLPERKDYSWPGGRRLAFTVTTNVEWFAFGAGLGHDRLEVRHLGGIELLEDAFLAAEAERHLLAHDDVDLGPGAGGDRTGDVVRGAAGGVPDLHAVLGFERGHGLLESFLPGTAEGRHHDGAGIVGDCRRGRQRQNHRRERGAKTASAPPASRHHRSSPSSFFPRVQRVDR